MKSFRILESVTPDKQFVVKSQLEAPIDLDPLMARDLLLFQVQALTCFGTIRFRADGIRLRSGCPSIPLYTFRTITCLAEYPAPFSRVCSQSKKWGALEDSRFQVFFISTWKEEVKQDPSQKAGEQGKKKRKRSNASYKARKNMWQVAVDN